MVKFELSKEYDDFIEEYLPYIKYRCNKVAFIVKDQIEDMQQFVVKEILMVYCKKDKYDDFDWVVRVIIRRKCMAFVKNYARNEKHIKLMNEGQVLESTSNLNDNAHITNKPYNDLANEQLIKNEKANDIIEFVKDIHKKITNKPQRGNFSDFDREFLDVVLELYSLGYEINKEEIMECMGFGKDEAFKFNPKLLSFRNKLKKHFNLDLDVVKERLQ